MFCRMAEVYAGFSEYTDAQVGRIVDYLEESGQLDNTIIFYCADNGASGEGSPNGSVNEGKIFGGYPDDLEQNLTMVDKLGSPDTYNHYPTGWATAFSTPYRMFKRYVYQGGVCDPLVIHWPAGIASKGEVRQQYHHSTDIVPTILDVCGVTMPEVYNGATQNPLSGVSMRYSFDAADAPTAKETQYYEMLGNRGIWHDGWKAVDRARPDGRHQHVRGRPLAAVPHRRGSGRGPRPRRRAPGQGGGAHRAVVRRRPRRTTCCRSTTCRSSAARRTSRRSSKWSSTCRCRPAVSTPTTRGRARCRSGRRRTCTTCRTRCSPRSISPPTARGSSSPTDPGSVVTPCSSRTAR